jgi:hypothetical protein
MSDRPLIGMLAKRKVPAADHDTKRPRVEEKCNNVNDDEDDQDDDGKITPEINADTVPAPLGQDHVLAMGRSIRLRCRVIRERIAHDINRDVHLARLNSQQAAAWRLTVSASRFNAMGARADAAHDRSMKRTAVIGSTAATDTMQAVQREIQRGSHVWEEQRRLGRAEVHTRDDYMRPRLDGSGDTDYPNEPSSGDE